MQGESASAIRSAIVNDRGGMGSLNFLTPAEIADLAAGK
jgi:hypothetical protein